MGIWISSEAVRQAFTTLVATRESAPGRPVVSPPDRRLSAAGDNRRRLRSVSPGGTLTRGGTQHEHRHRLAARARQARSAPATTSPPGHYVAAGRTAVVRRRRATAVVLAAAVVIGGGTAWAVRPGSAVRGDAPVGDPGRGQPQEVTEPDGVGTAGQADEAARRMRRQAEKPDFLGEPATLDADGLVLAPGAGHPCWSGSRTRWATPSGRRRGRPASRR